MLLRGWYLSWRSARASRRRHARQDHVERQYVPWKSCGDRGRPAASSGYPAGRLHRCGRRTDSTGDVVVWSSAVRTSSQGNRRSRSPLYSRTVDDSAPQSLVLGTLEIRIAARPCNYDSSMVCAGGGGTVARVRSGAYVTSRAACESRDDCFLV